MRNLFTLLLLTFLISNYSFAEIKVGFIGGFSGPGKEFGDAARNGFELAKKEFGSQGLKVIYEDNRFLPAKTVSSFQKLTNVDKVDLLVVLGSNPASAIVSLAERKKIPTIVWGSAKHLTKNRKWIIRSWASGADEGKILSNKASQLGLKNIGTVTYTDEYADAVLNGFIKSTHAKTFNLGEVNDLLNFKTIALRAKAKKLDGIFLCLNVGQSANLALHLREIKFKPVLLGCETLNNINEKNLAKGALDGAFYATVPVTEKFKKKYYKAFKLDSLLGGVAVHYELFKILLNLPKKELSNNKIMDEFFSVNKTKSSLGDFRIIKEGSDQRFELPIEIKSL